MPSAVPCVTARDDGGSTATGLSVGRGLLAGPAVLGVAASVLKIGRSVGRVLSSRPGGSTRQDPPYVTNGLQPFYQYNGSVIPGTTCGIRTIRFKIAGW